jgi:hypothetical protein
LFAFLVATLVAADASSKIAEIELGGFLERAHCLCLVEIIESDVALAELGADLEGEPALNRLASARVVERIALKLPGSAIAGPAAPPAASAKARQSVAAIRRRALAGTMNGARNGFGRMAFILGISFRTGSGPSERVRARGLPPPGRGAARREPDSQYGLSLPGINGMAAAAAPHQSRISR